MSDSEINTKHQEAMQEKQKVVREAIDNAKEKRGIIVYLYGNGKGKSSSGFGTLLRAVGHGQTASIIQFIKGKWKTGEQLFFADHPRVSHHIMGTGFTWDTQNRESDIAAAKELWGHTEKALKDESINLVLIDELTYMFDYDYLSRSTVIDALKNRPKMQNVIVTGRTLIPELEEISDTISEIRDVKHAFRSGIRAQKGIEY